MPAGRSAEALLLFRCPGIPGFWDVPRPGTRGDSRSELTTAPITTWPQAQRKFSGSYLINCPCTDWRKERSGVTPAPFWVLFRRGKSIPGYGDGAPVDAPRRRRTAKARLRSAGGLFSYPKNSLGSTAAPSLVTEKWRWAPRPASLREVLPTVPMTVPALTSSPARTFVSGWRLA